MNIKALKEQLNNKITDLAGAKVEGLETRSLEQEIEELRQEIIQRQAEIRENTVTISDQEEGEEKMKDLNLELRKMTKNDGLVDVSDIEYRANVVTAGANTALGSNTQHPVPTNFIQGVIMEAQHDNFLLQQCRLLQTENETKLTVADFMDEMKDLTELEEIALEDFVTSEKSVTLSRKGCATMVSRHLINSANFDVTGHVGKVFGHSLAVTCESLVAKALDNDATLEAGKVVVEGTVINTIVGVLAKMPEVSRANACIFMNPTDYAELLQLEDKNGRNLLDFNYQNSLRASVCGVPIIVSEKVKAIYVGSLKDAVVVGLNVRSIESEVLPRRDAVSFAMNAYLGSTVVLPSAIVKIKKTA